jgi:enoyl-[acyl-carrier-protein] reductase (NADH)
VWLIDLARTGCESGGVPLEKAARLCIYLASELSDGITGETDQRAMGSLG